MRMRKGLRRGQFDIYSQGSGMEEGNIGRRGMSGVSAMDDGSRLFFQRLTSMKKIREFVFITKASAKNR